MDSRLILDKEWIRDYVGQTSFQKGEIYTANQAIHLGKIKHQVISALCKGHQFDPYKVEAIFSEQGISQSYCSCPVGAGGKCKHIAALLLTWLDHPEKFVEWQEVRNHLKGYDMQTLLELIDLLDEKDVAKAIESYHSAAIYAPATFKDANKFLLALRLAAAARHKYPLIAIQIYQQAVQDLVEERSRDSYRRACDYLKVIRDIYRETQNHKGWNAYLRTFMQTYNRLKALKDEMQQVGLI